jgi:hypothetical protein
MRVRMIQHLSGTSHELRPGQEYDLPEAEALRLVAAGFADAIAAPAPIETATNPPPIPKLTADARRRRTPRN